MPDPSAWWWSLRAITSSSATTATIGNDSRFIGFIERRRIVGKAVGGRFSPIAPAHFVPRFDRFFEGLERALGTSQPAGPAVEQHCGPCLPTSDYGGIPDAECGAEIDRTCTRSR